MAAGGTGTGRKPVSLARTWPEKITPRPERAIPAAANRSTTHRLQSNHQV